MRVVNVKDLVGTDVAGLRADVRTRRKGKLEFDAAVYSVSVGRLTRVYTRKPDASEREAFKRQGFRTDGLWVCLEYEGTGSGRSSMYDDMAETWQIAILEPGEALSAR